MTATLLTWREANQQDRGSLSQFICTDPAKRPYAPGMKLQHPREWELEVQSGLRAQRPPYGDDTFLLLGHEPSGQIGAMTLTTFSPYFAVTIRAVAVAQHLRGQPTKYGPEALGVTLDMINGFRASTGRSFAVVQAYIHPRNGGSKKLFTTYGFAPAPSDDPALELWALAL